MNNDIIKINLDFFKNKLKNYNYNDIIYDDLNKMKQELILTYSCFNEKYDSKFLWEKKKMKKNYYKTTYNQRYNNNVSNNNDKKLYTFTTNKVINNDKKKLISLLNKLSISNKDVIITSINDILRTYTNKTELIEILYIYIGKNNDTLYIEVVKNIIENDKNIFYDFLRKINYIIDDKYINSNIMLDENYDNFCDFKKDKTKNVNMFKSFIYIIEEVYDVNIDTILQDISDNILSIINNLNNSKSYIVNYYLELLLILKKIKINDLNINLKNYDKSTKFLVDKFDL